MPQPRLSYRRVLAAAAIISGLALTGCTRNTLIVIAPAPQQVFPLAVCNEPPGSPAVEPAATPVHVDNHTNFFPPQATAAGIRIGCAGVLFRLDPDGNIIDQRVLVEFPANYGFGEAAQAFSSTMKFAPGVIDPNWHYLRVVMRWIPRLVQPQPAPPPSGAVQPWGLTNS